MGIEFELATEKRRTLVVPLAGIKDHYIKEGYRVVNVEIVHKEIMKYNPDTSSSIQMIEARKLNPKAKLLKTLGTYMFIDPSDPEGLEITLELIEKTIKKEKKNGN